MNFWHMLLVSRKISPCSPNTLVKLSEYWKVAFTVCCWNI